jgi:predicted RNase H-like HicB family nuclease
MVKEFIALVYKNEDSAYGISFLDVPGRFSAADTDTETDIQANTSEALSLWFENGYLNALPSATGLDDPDRRFADDIHHGAYLLPVYWQPEA